MSWLPPIEAKRNGIIVSYTLTCTVGSNDILEYTIKTKKQSIYFGVYERETDYSCDILASTAAGDGPTASLSFTTGGKIIIYVSSHFQSLVFTLDSSTPVYLPFIPVDYLYEVSNAVNLTVADDVASSAITLPTSFPFGGVDQTRVYVRIH